MKTKILTTVGFVLALTTTSAMASNAVFIEQLGNTNIITINQIGSMNTVGSSTTHSTVNGNDNSLTASQTGDGNILNYSVTGDSNTIIKSITGNTNTVTMTCGDSGTPCTNVSSSTTVQGNLNSVTQTIKGSNITNTLSITGDSNIVTQDIQTSNSTSVITILGDSNTFNSTMMGASAGGGHHLMASVTGTSNIHNVTQYGTVDTSVSIVTNGSSNNVTVNTGM